MGLGMPLTRPSGRVGKSSDTYQQAHTSKPAGALVLHVGRPTPDDSPLLRLVTVLRRLWVVRCFIEATLEHS